VDQLRITLWMKNRQKPLVAPCEPALPGARSLVLDDGVGFSPRPRLAHDVSARGGVVGIGEAEACTCATLHQDSMAGGSELAHLDGA